MTTTDREGAASPEAAPSTSDSTSAQTGWPPALADGVQLIGEYEGSGYKEPPALVRRADGQVIQLTPLLYAVAEAADGQRSYDEIAAAVTEASDRGVSGDNVRQLVEDKLRPMGVLTAADGTSPSVEKADPLLALRFRKVIVPEHRSKAIASLFKPFFFPPVVLAVLGAFIAFDIWLFGVHGLARGFHDAMYQPSLILLVFGFIVIGVGFHEFGHAAGCAYGGGKPGAMGAGVYVAWPAFYTDVTDAYSLNRAGRLRTDLAGVYFNILFVLALGAAYFATGFEPLLIVVAVQHFEMVHQLLPLLRLDGYYVIADLTGVPDLFARIKPILTSAIPWRRADDSVRQLKRWVRVVVTVWVLVIVPLLAFQVLYLLLHLPRILATAWDSFQKQAGALGRVGDDPLGAVAAVVQIAALGLPILGILFTLYRLGQKLIAWSWRATEGKPLARVGAGAGWAAALAALAFTWMPNGDYEPVRRSEKGTLGEAVVAARRVTDGRPSMVPAERAEATPATDGREAPAGREPAAEVTTTTEADHDHDDDTPRSTSTTARRSTATTLRSTSTTDGSP